MALKFVYPGVLLLGLAITAGVGLAALLLRRKSDRRGVRAANTQRFRALPVYKRKRRWSIAYRILLSLGLIVSLAAAIALAARPYRRSTAKKTVNHNDIFLCMDLSASSCTGLSGFVDGFRGLVSELEGDQVGVCLFNTSSQQYVPVTEDYAFVSQRLEELAAYCDAAGEFQTTYADQYQYASEIPREQRARYNELNEMLYAFDRGVTAGYEKKGTSAIGEGLAACLFSFPELETQQRNRIIIFVTDNQPEYIGEPLTTLEEVAEMCAYDHVKVYGVYPAAETEENAQARAQMKTAVESTGGAFFQLDGGAAMEQLLSAIRSEVQRESETAVSIRDEDTPELMTLVLLGGIALLLALLILLLIKTGWRMLRGWPARRRRIALGAATAAAACIALIIIRPTRLDLDEEICTDNLDVCFAVDTTISMWAEDYNAGQERMAGVKQDIARIMEALPGSSFSLVRFDNGAQVLVPYVRGVAVVEDTVSHITLPSYNTAEGSTINAVHDTLAAMIRASKERSGTRKTIVFLMSDGEITDGSELMRFSDLAEGVDDGAVLGYGTAAGGRMNYPGRGYLQDTARKADALSILDEENLRAVAGDLGLNYIHQQAGGNLTLNQILNRIRRLSVRAAQQEGDRTGVVETYYYFAALLALILLAGLFRLIRRGNIL